MALRFRVCFVTSALHVRSTSSFLHACYTHATHWSEILVGPSVGESYMKASALAALLSAILLSTVASADEPAARDLGPPIGKDALAKRYLGLNADNIHDGPFAGLYEVAVDMN